MWGGEWGAFTQYIYKPGPWRLKGKFHPRLIFDVKNFILSIKIMWKFIFV